MKETNSTTNQSVSYTYDAFGRVSSITDPFNIKQTITTGWASSAGITAPSNAISFIKKQRPNTPWIVEFYDALGRKLQTATETFSGISKVDYNYTAKGQLESQTMPYYSSSDKIISLFNMTIMDALYPVHKVQQASPTATIRTR